MTDSSLRPEDMVLTPELLDQIAAFVAKIAEPFGERFGGDDGTKRLGGCFCILNKDGDQLLHKMVGSPRQAKRNDYRRNASLKCIGMWNRKDDPFCISSWTFIDHAADPPCYGGGIKLANGDYMAFSGYLEIEDEALCLLTANQFGLIDARHETAIVQISGNGRMHDVDLWMKGQISN